MALTFRHVRRHWKKYLAGQLLGAALASYLVRKHREKNVIREYCNVAKRFGEEKSGTLERPRKVMIFLNQTANNSDAKIQFNKYCFPLLSLSGLDVTVVESEYQGHIQMLMTYVDPKTDAIVIAGGDGTVMEVLNGLMRRKDAVSEISWLTNAIVMTSGSGQVGGCGHSALGQGESLLQNTLSSC